MTWRIFWFKDVLNGEQMPSVGQNRLEKCNRDGDKQEEDKMNERAEKILRSFRENKAYMEDRVQSGIEANRKGFARFNVVDEQGNPVKNVSLKLRQKTHDFKFGANIFMLDELETEEKNQQYKERFAQLFNLATVPFYWTDLEPVQGKPRFAKDSPKVYRRPAPDLCLEYCEANHIEPKLHCLNYDQWSPMWLPNDVPTVKKYLDKRIAEIAERYADKIPSMEVINETQCSEHFHDYRHSTLFFREPDIVEWSFEHARKYLPANELIINEATSYCWTTGFKYNRSAYYMQIERALAKGASIDAVGMQYHAFYKREVEEEKTKQLYDPKQLYRVMDQYSDFGKPLQVTEVTIPAYSWEIEDEEIQAEIITNLYKIWFSHPNMEAVIYWNLVDGYAAFAEQGDMTSGENYYHGGLLRYDLSPKPAFYALDELINKTWRTNLSAEALDGNLEVKGFYGEYEVEVSAGGKTAVTTVHLEKNADNRFTIVL